jgi:Mu-like prophage major head subunit gpT
MSFSSKKSTETNLIGDTLMIANEKTICASVNTNEIIHATVLVEAGKEASGDGVELVGVMYTGGALKVNSYRYPNGIVIDLATLVIPDSVPIMLDHRSDLTARLGSARAKVTGGQILIEGAIVGGTPESDRAIALLRADILSLSIGVAPGSVREIPAGQAITVNGREFTGPVHIADGSELVEVSGVGIGADRDAKAIAASAAGTPSNGNDPIKAERMRVKEIHAAFHGLGEDGQYRADQLVEDGASVAVARGEALGMLRARRPRFSGVMREDSGVDFGRVQACAFMMHAGSRDAATRHFDERTLDQAEAMQKRSGSLLGLVAETLRASGHPVPQSQDQLIQAAFSSSALAGIVSDTITITALDAFQRSTEAWRSYAKRLPFSNFKENKVARRAGTLQFKSLAPGGEIKHGTVDAETTSIKLDTKAAMIVIDRKTIINDDAGLLADIPHELGLEAARVVGDSMAVLLADAGGTFFTTSRGNYITGATTVLGIDGLTQGVTALRVQTDSSGRRINLPPAFLVVPPELEMVARGLVNSSELRNPAGTESATTGNPLQNIAEVLVDARLAAPEWYLFSLPENGAAIVGTLNGADAPQVDSADPGFNQLGLGWRGYYDYGVALHEYRGIVKSKGAV